MLKVSKQQPTFIMSDCDIDKNSCSNDTFDLNQILGSDEDTEDSSETDHVIKHQEFVEIKEQIYQEKLVNLKEQLRQLQDRVHPEYLERLQKLEEKYEENINMTMAFQKVALERVDREYELEKLAALQEFEEKRIALKEHLIQELEKKKKLIEAERDTMDLTSDDNLLEMTELPIMRKLINQDKSSLHVADLALIRSLVLEDLTDTKPIQTRRLRRRANDAASAPEKKRKITFNQINFLLDEKEIEEDLKLIRACTSTSKLDDNDKIFQNQNDVFEVKVDDGKLQYNKKWFHRGQNVYYKGKDVGNKKAGVILSINPSEICIKKSNSSKMYIKIPQLQNGAFILKKRAV